MAIKLPSKSEVETSPSQDFTNRHETDAFLRRHGYIIVSRKEGKEPMWCKIHRNPEPQSVILERLFKVEYEA